MTSSIGRPQHAQPALLKRKSEDLRNYVLSKKAANDRFLRTEPGWRQQGITAVLLQPGYVSTRMNERFIRTASAKDRRKIISPETSAGGLKVVLEKLSSQSSGKMFDWKGHAIPLGQCIEYTAFASQIIEHLCFARNSHTLPCACTMQARHTPQRNHYRRLRSQCCSFDEAPLRACTMRRVF